MAASAKGAVFRPAPIDNGLPSTWSPEYVQLHERAVPKAITDVFHNFDGQQLLRASKEQWIYYLGDRDGSGLFDELRVPYSYDDAASALYGGSFSPEPMERPPELTTPLPGASAQGFQRNLYDDLQLTLDVTESQDFPELENFSAAQRASRQSPKKAKPLVGKSSTAHKAFDVIINLLVAVPPDPEIRQRWIAVFPWLHLLTTNWAQYNENVKQGDGALDHLFTFRGLGNNAYQCARWHPPKVVEASQLRQFALEALSKDYTTMTPTPNQRLVFEYWQSCGWQPGGNGEARWFKLLLWLEEKVFGGSLERVVGRGAERDGAGGNRSDEDPVDDEERRRSSGGGHAQRAGKSRAQKPSSTGRRSSKVTAKSTAHTVLDGDICESAFEDSQVYHHFDATPRSPDLVGPPEPLELCEWGVDVQKMNARDLECGVVSTLRSIASRSTSPSAVMTNIHGGTSRSTLIRPEPACFKPLATSCRPRGRHLRARGRAFHMILSHS
eukprot:m.193301 g.193301  ORF g.193301 m.193301 type:complete len:497 (+) comp15181_c1_seq1:89-1579(+)